MLAVDRQGIDYPARVIQRCRHDRVSPWISLRMNDCHDGTIANHPIHGSFWRKHPEWRRQNGIGNYATCLDYAHPEVRDYYMALFTRHWSGMTSTGWNWTSCASLICSARERKLRGRRS